MAERKPTPPTRQLMIDLDLVVDESWLQNYRRVVKLVLGHYGLRATAIRITPSLNKGYHVRIYLSKLLPASLANMFQLLLCDDHRRVDFNRARINVGFDEWDKFFEDPRT
jgi:hypothetical protein